MRFYFSVNKFVPHKLTDDNKAKRLEICQELLARKRRRGFFRNLVTCDESWINYDGTAQRTVWRKNWKETALVPRPDRHQKKQMLCIYWTVHGPLHWEQQFETSEQVKAALEAFFDSKRGTDFYERGIKKLPFRWQYTINAQGNYFRE